MTDHWQRDQAGSCVYALVRNERGTYDRLRVRAGQRVMGWDDKQSLWVECELKRVRGGKEVDPLEGWGKEPGK